MVDAGVLTPERRDGAEWPCWSAVHGFAELALHGPLRHARRRDVEALAYRTVDDIVAGRGLTTRSTIVTYAVTALTRQCKQISSFDATNADQAS